MTTKVDGRRVVTPMLIVMVAIGTTDLLFALDSIPAIFGLTKEPYLVFTANAFALMGLRQLFFLIGGLLDKLVYLSIGLAVVLGFIGLKLVMEALHHDGVAWAPEIPILVSLAVIVGTLAITTVASLWKVRRDRDTELAQVTEEAPQQDPA
jgi:tellurite resistance protein TerC